MTSVQLDMLDGRRKRRSPSIVPLESQEQEALVAWARIHQRRHPELALLHAVLNGGYWLPPALARAMRRRGLLAGIPDLYLPVARCGQHGLYLELKRRKGGVVSDAQREIHDSLRGQGYRVVVARGWEEARDALVEYLGGEQ